MIYFGVLVLLYLALQLGALVEDGAEGLIILAVFNLISVGILVLRIGGAI